MSDLRSEIYRQQQAMLRRRRRAQAITPEEQAIERRLTDFYNHWLRWRYTPFYERLEVSMLETNPTCEGCNQVIADRYCFHLKSTPFIYCFKCLYEDLPGTSL